MKVDNSKYGKYVLREPRVSTSPQNQVPIYVNSDVNDEVTLDIAFDFCTSLDDIGPIPPPHKHDFDEYIFFLGGNPQNYLDFGAEIDICLGSGEDQETYTIDTAAFVYVPKGLIHMPMTYKKVDKPIITGHIFLAPKWSMELVE